jgi:hypothetical protein
VGIAHGLEARAASWKQGQVARSPGRPETVLESGSQ